MHNPVALTHHDHQTLPQRPDPQPTPAQTTSDRKVPLLIKSDFHQRHKATDPIGDKQSLIVL